MARRFKHDSINPLLPVHGNLEDLKKASKNCQACDFMETWHPDHFWRGHALCNNHVRWRAPGRRGIFAGLAVYWASRKIAGQGSARRRMNRLATMPGSSSLLI